MTNHQKVVARAKSKRELIYTLARPHMLRSSERWLAASMGRPVYLAVGNPHPGATTSEPQRGPSSWSLCDLFCDAPYRAPSWFATSNTGGRLVALGHSQWSVGWRFARWARTSLASAGMSTYRRYSEADSRRCFESCHVMRTSCGQLSSAHHWPVRYPPPRKRSR